MAAAVVIATACGATLFWLTLPDVRPLRGSWPERTAYMERRLEEARAAGGTLRIRYRPVPLSRIPVRVQRAVLVAEDAGFYGHGGFDWTELREAVRRAWERAEPPRGASTITQQLARNLYLSPDRSWLRKLREAFLARRLERELGKRRILELYLNVIELGEGVFGVEAGASRYFGVSIPEVSDRQAAMLAASIPAPRRDNPATDTRVFRWRTRLIAGRAFGAVEDAPPPDTAAAPSDSAAAPSDTTAAPPDSAPAPPDSAPAAPPATGARGQRPSPSSAILRFSSRS